MKRAFDSEAGACLARLQEVYPELAPARIRTVRTGQYNLILVLDETHVVRFPRFAGGVAALARQTALLRALRGRTTLPIPDPQLVCLTPPHPGQVFSGYPLLPGVPLQRERLAAASEAALSRLADGLAAFVRELHAVPLALLPLPPAPPRLDAWADLYARVQAWLFPHMPAQARRDVAQRFDRFLADDDACEPVLIHGDLGGSNILIDARTLAPRAVIDFDSAAAGDPALDLAALATLGPALFERLRARLTPDTATLARAAFYQGTFALQEALYGVECNDTAALTRGLREHP